MTLDQKLLARFEELVQKGRTIQDMPHGDVWQAKRQAFMAWTASCKHLIAQAIGQQSVHFIQFQEQYADAYNHKGIAQTITSVESCLGVLEGAYDDFKHEMLFNTRTAIEAEVFDDFLEQAQSLFKSGYYQAAAVVAGAVLEDALRKICTAQNIAVSEKATINPLNDELAKLGVYNLGWKKRITALADTRNLAAHGRWDELEADDVERMLRDIEDFMRREFEDAKAFVSA